MTISSHSSTITCPRQDFFYFTLNCDVCYNQAPITGILMNSSVNNEVRTSALQSEIRTEIEIGPLGIVNRTDENFDDLIERRQFKSGNLYALNELRLQLMDGGKLTLINSFTGRTDAGYTDLQEILMNKAGFINVEFEQSNKMLTATAVKRPAVAIDIGYGMTIREMISEREIRECHDFAEEIYFWMKMFCRFAKKRF